MSNPFDPWRSADARYAIAKLRSELFGTVVGFTFIKQLDIRSKEHQRNADNPEEEQSSIRTMRHHHQNKRIQDGN